MYVKLVPPKSQPKLKPNFNHFLIELCYKTKTNIMIDGHLLKLIFARKMYYMKNMSMLKCSKWTNKNVIFLIFHLIDIYFAYIIWVCFMC